VCKGSVVDGVDTVFEVLAGQEGEIDRRREFWPPGADTMRNHSALIPGRKRGVGCAKEVLWMGWILYLRCWQAGKVRLTGGGGFGPLVPIPYALIQH
jgi:hypothetical protein